MLYIHLYVFSIDYKSFTSCFIYSVCNTPKNYKEKRKIKRFITKISSNYIHIFYSLVVTAVSPNVVVTVLLNLKEERLGLYKGIHTIILAMTSCNDVIAIFLFGVVLSVIFSTGRIYIDFIIH